MSKQLGDKIKEFIDRTLDCRDCGRALEIPEKGICCTDCGKNFRWNDELKQDFDQLIEKAARVDELENIIFGKFKKGEYDNQLLNIVVKNVHKHVEYIELGEAFKWAEENKFRFRYGNDYWDVGGILQAYRNEVSNV